MIFVTVGTHEQSYDRLVKKMDELVCDGVIKEEVFIQTGYTDYVPLYCKYKSMIGNDEMDEYAKYARIVITHGGPGSIMLPFQYDKMPIVVPRQHKFGEHVDDHQVKFTKKLEACNKVIAVYDIQTLKDKILHYDKLSNSKTADYKGNTLQFVKRFEEICTDLVLNNK